MSSSSVAPSPSGSGAAPVERADVIVVGAGPGGSATAAYLADHGLDVVLLEKSAFPRDKICGDGLTPRATKELISLGVDTTRLAAHQGPAHQGRRPHAAARLARVRRLPAATAWSAPARSSTRPWPATRSARAPGSTSARASPRPLRDSSGRVTGVTAKRLDDAGRATGRDRHVPRPGRRRERRRVLPARHRRRSAQARGPRHGRRRPRLLHDARARRLPREPPRAVEPRRRRQPHPACPATAGSSRSRTAAPTSASASLDTTSAFQKTDYKDVMRRWVEDITPEWQLEHDEAGRPDPRRRAADGLQPHAALRRRPAAGRRLRRHGQPVQRRGHRLRPRGRRGSAPSVVAQALARPSDAAARAGARRPTPRS